MCATIRWIEAFRRVYPQKFVTKGLIPGGRGPTTYGLTLEMQSGDEVHLNVSQKAWYTLKKGDRFTVFLYKGALNEPYYIYEE